MSEITNNDLVVRQVIKKYIEKNNEIIKKVINYKNRIPSVKYKKIGNELHICLEYYFIQNIYIKVKLTSDNFKLSFLDSDNNNNDSSNGIFCEKKREKKEQLLQDVIDVIKLDNPCISDTKNDIKNDIKDDIKNDVKNNFLIKENTINTNNQSKDTDGISEIYSHDWITFLKEKYNRKLKNCIILLTGTSGRGKSTISCLLAMLLNIKRIISTDVIREILKLYNVKNVQFLNYSTYELWKLNTSKEEEKEKKVNQKETGIIEFATRINGDEKTEHKKNIYFKKNHDNNQPNGNININITSPNDYHHFTNNYNTDIHKTLINKCLKNYANQCDILFNYIDHIIADHIKNNESLIMEGVHLNFNTVNKLIQKYPNKLIYFLVYINNRETTIQRFTNRLYGQTQTENKYIKNINYIDEMQKCLIENFKKLGLPIHYVQNIDIFNSLENIIKQIYLYA
ncbi:conserved protein, unknown function [Hepatocystis sp. ex Piliocolobus tephrosceles]|nr:conserved protein, unknown function [Hepatocystis sp. ex Piliocolobus tephrosceles]